MNKFLTLLSKNPYLCDIVWPSYYLSPSLRSALKQMPHCDRIPNFPYIRHVFYQIRDSEFESKYTMFIKLVNESGLNKKHSPQNILERIIAVSSSVKQLQKLNLIHSLPKIEESLLSHLEPFPFDRNEMLRSKKQNGNDFTILQIRDAIETQYLAWKFKLGLHTINYIFLKLSSCFYKYRNIGDLSQNITALEKLPVTSTLSVAEKIYLLNQKPFDIQSIASFEPIVAGLSWHVIAEICPRIFTHSHEYILFVVSLLKVNKWELSFSEAQIQKAVPFLYLRFPSFVSRLNHILSIESLANYRNDENFLLLLSYGLLKLKILVAKKAGYRHLTTSVPDRFSVSKRNMLDFVSELLPIDNETKTLLSQYSKEFTICPIQIQDTLNFLKGLKFSNAEISEAIKIIFYPREAIQKALAKIESEAENLKKYGFHKGFVMEKTNIFKCGSKEQNKCLQLCLYYLEIEGIADRKNLSEKTDLIFFNYEIIPD